MESQNYQANNQKFLPPTSLLLLERWPVMELQFRSPSALNSGVTNTFDIIAAEEEEYR